MSLFLISVLAAGCTAWLAVASGWNVLMILLGFLVCFGAIALVAFAEESGGIIRFLCAGATLAAGIAAASDGSLWTFIWVFFAADVALILLAIAFLFFVCALVDLDKPQEDKDSKFYRTIMYPYIRMLMDLFLVRLTTKGTENIPQDGRFLLVCNHQHMADPGVLLHVFRRSQLAFITKQENMTMPIINKFMHKILCQPLNREDDRQALKVILKCIQLIKDDLVSIGVFPEGYTTRDGRVRHFRHGVFKIAQKANVPIVVCTIKGSFDIFHNILRLKRSPVELHLVDVIPAEELKGKTTVEIGERVYEMMIADLGEEYRAIDSENT